MADSRGYIIRDFVVPNGEERLPELQSPNLCMSEELPVEFAGTYPQVRPQSEERFHNQRWPD